MKRVSKPKVKKEQFDLDKSSKILYNCTIPLENDIAVAFGLSQEERLTHIDRKGCMPAMTANDDDNQRRGTVHATLHRIARASGFPKHQPSGSWEEDTDGYPTLALLAKTSLPQYTQAKGLLRCLHEHQWDFDTPEVVEALIAAQTTPDGEEEAPRTQYVVFAALDEMTGMPLPWVRNIVVEYADEQLTSERCADLTARPTDPCAT